MSEAKKQRTSHSVDGPRVGRFTEDVVRVLKENLEFEDYTLDVKSLESSPNPLHESVTIRVQVCRKVCRKVTESADVSQPRRVRSRGPVLTFSFDSAASVEANMSEFREFIVGHCETASSAPVVTRSLAASLT